MKPNNYEIKVTVTKELYNRVLQEAQAKNSKMARIVRESIMQYFALREELATSLESPGELGEHHTGKIIHTLLARTEARFAMNIKLVEDKLFENDEKLQLLIKMVDRFYFDLMMYLPEIPKNILSNADYTAKLRHEKWLNSF